MCQGRVDFEAIERQHGIAMDRYFRDELAALQGLVEAGLVVRAHASLQVTATGWYFIRAVAMVFDNHLAAQDGRERYSRAV